MYSVKIDIFSILFLRGVSAWPQHRNSERIRISFPVNLCIIELYASHKSQKSQEPLTVPMHDSATKSGTSGAIGPSILWAKVTATALVSSTSLGVSTVK
jgi:hypothetical protein